MFIAACSDDPVPKIQKEKITIFFDSKSKIEIKENEASEILIPIKISLPQKDPIIIAYEVIGQEVVEGSDFTLLSENPLTIAAGSTQAEVRIRINDNNIVQLEERNIYLRFRAIDQDYVKIAIPKEVKISIKEDDCSSDVSDVRVWMGALTMQSSNETLTGIGSENSKGICSGIFNLKGKFVGSQNPESTLIFNLTQDQMITTKGVVTINRTKLFEFTSQYEFEATGTYDETTKKIILNYSFFDLIDSSNDFRETIVITSE
ncbi:hypothetical protein MASR2M41_01860 [Flammeovirgaceae bacterium]